MTAQDTKKSRFRTLREKLGLSLSDLKILFPNVELFHLENWDTYGSGENALGRLIERVLSFPTSQIQNHLGPTLVMILNRYAEARVRPPFDVFLEICEIIKKVIPDQKLQASFIIAFSGLLLDVYMKGEVQNDHNGNMTGIAFTKL